MTEFNNTTGANLVNRHRENARDLERSARSLDVSGDSLIEKIYHYLFLRKQARIDHESNLKKAEQLRQEAYAHRNELHEEAKSYATARSAYETRRSKLKEATGALYTPTAMNVFIEDIDTFNEDDALSFEEKGELTAAMDFFTPHFSEVQPMSSEYKKPALELSGTSYRTFWLSERIPRLTAGKNLHDTIVEAKAKDAKHLLKFNWEITIKDKTVQKEKKYFILDESAAGLLKKFNEWFSAGIPLFNWEKNKTMQRADGYITYSAEVEGIPEIT